MLFEFSLANYQFCSKPVEPEDLESISSEECVIQSATSVPSPTSSGAEDAVYCDACRIEFPKRQEEGHYASKKHSKNVKKACEKTQKADEDFASPENSLQWLQSGLAKKMAEK